MVAKKSKAQRQIEALSQALAQMESTTLEASRCCDQLTKRARHLDSLTSPASDASSTLSQASTNLGATLVLMKDAREKFDTIADCEPSIERLNKGVTELDERRKKGGTRIHKPTDFRRNNTDDDSNTVILTEQDVYAAADSMEIIRDAHEYFLDHKNWRSTTTFLNDLERVHKLGVTSMCKLVESHLIHAALAIRHKRRMHHQAAVETAQDTRERLSAALQNRDLLKVIGEYEDYQPVEPREVRELRGVFECLGGNGYHLGPLMSKEPPGLASLFGVSGSKLVRSEKIGSGGSLGFLSQPLRTGFPHIDAYGNARKGVAFSGLDGFYRRLKEDRKRNEGKDLVGAMDEADVAARDAVRCLEHAMIVVAGEKNIYRTVVNPSLAKPKDDDDSAVEISPFYRKACSGAYAYVVSTVVDLVLDIIETVFVKEGGIGQNKHSDDGAPTVLVGPAGSAAVAGLRMLDGVRMLGPSMAKLCEMPTGNVNAELPSIASSLCIAIHRTTVKNTARCLENLAKAIQEDPLKGKKYRPKDASIAPVTKQAVHAIRIVSPFVSAYKSVSKRRALPWDPNVGEQAGEIESFVRFLVMRLLNSLKGKALNYTRDAGDDAHAKSSLFMINNTFYLLQQLGPKDFFPDQPPTGGDEGRIEGSWFTDKVNKIYESEKAKYTAHWEVLNTHLTAVDQDEIEYHKNDSTILSLESGRHIKTRFSGFNEEFERIYNLHKELSVIDEYLRQTMQEEVKAVFIPRYSKFYNKYTRIRFSRKHQDEYTKYSPQRIEAMLEMLYYKDIN